MASELKTIEIEGDVGEVAVVVRTSQELEQWHVKLELTAERLEL